ncbi:MAG: hypothetical protein J4F36_03815 [Nitrosopumilaceae archaeon]|nr:hypothetical protein [Nitrosopumilaceae archaeon]
MLVSEDPVGEMDVVAVGTIVSVVPGTNSYGVPETQYVVDVEEIIKGSNILEEGINTQSLEFSAPGVLDSQDNPVYRKIFGPNDRVLLMLEHKDGSLHESLWSRTTPSNCNDNELIQLFDAPSGFSIHQNNQDTHFYTNHPVIVQYSFFNKNMTAITQNVTINAIDDFPDIYHSESFVLNLDECQAYATATTEFVMDKPSSISVHTVVNGETSHVISGLDVVEHILPPLKQTKSGILADEIQCRENLTLIKKHNGSPACVTHETKEKLIERGWMAISPDFETQREIARQIYLSIPKTADSPYLGMVLGDDRKSLLFGIDVTKLTSEKNQEYYEKFFEDIFSEITIPYEIRFQENLGGEE